MIISGVIEYLLSVDQIPAIDCPFVGELPFLHIPET